MSVLYPSVIFPCREMWCEEEEEEEEAGVVLLAGANDVLARLVISYFVGSTLGNANLISIWCFVSFGNSLLTQNTLVIFSIFPLPFFLPDP